MRKEDFEIFIQKFCPVEQSQDNFLFETYGPDWDKVKTTDPQLIWTLLDCNGKLYISPGRAFVNRMNYFICKNPWKEGQRDYFYC